MPANLISGVLSAAGLLDNPFRLTNKTKGNRVCQSVKVLRVKFIYHATVMRHMLEDGTTVADARIIQPSGVEVSLFCPTIDAVSQVLAVLNDRESVYTLSSRGITVDNVMLGHNTMRQSAENLSSAPMTLSFSEPILKAEESPVTKQEGDSSAVKRGISDLSSKVAEVANGAGGIVGGVVGGALGQEIGTKVGAAVTGAVGDVINNALQPLTTLANDVAATFDFAMGNSNTADVAKYVMKRIL